MIPWPGRLETLNTPASHFGAFEQVGRHPVDPLHEERVGQRRGGRRERRRHNWPLSVRHGMGRTRVYVGPPTYSANARLDMDWDDEEPFASGYPAPQHSTAEVAWPPPAMAP